MSAETIATALGGAPNRAERRRQAAELRRRRAKWERGIIGFHEQAGGAFAAQLFRLNGAPPSPGASRAIVNWCIQAATGRDIQCIACDSVFGRDGWPKAFVVVQPYGNPAKTGLVSGVCANCANTDDVAVYEACRQRLAHIWPSLREVSVAHLHATGGQA